MSVEAQRNSVESDSGRPDKRTAERTRSNKAAMLAAVRTAERIDKGNIVVVFPDRAEKYLSTVMFDGIAEY